MPAISLPGLQELALFSSHGEPGLEDCIQQFRVFKRAMRQDPADFRLVIAKPKSKGKKRGGDEDADTSGLGVGDAGVSAPKGGAKKPQKKKTAKKKKRKSKGSDSGDDSDEDDDDGDWKD